LRGRSVPGLILEVEFAAGALGFPRRGFRSFLLFFVATWHQCLPDATLRLGPKFADKSAVWKLFSQHESDYASRNIGLRRSIRLAGGPAVLLLSQIME
jgi:hypothetical protein